MDFSSIIKQQLLLDEAIKKAHSLKKEFKDEMLIALYTEIGEFANEIQSFKYWKKQKDIDQELLQEEYADGIHFLISFALKTNCDYIIEPTIISNDINKQLLAMFSSINKLVENLSKENVEQSIAIYLGLAKLLNMSDEVINEAYLKKNKKNFERIKNNY